MLNAGFRVPYNCSLVCETTSVTLRFYKHSSHLKSKITSLPKPILLPEFPKQIPEPSAFTSVFTHTQESGGVSWVERLWD